MKFDDRAKDWDKKQVTLDKTEACIVNLKQKLDFSKIKYILDYGCGTGLVAFSLVDDSNEVLGLDNSDGMVDEFNKKVKDRSLLNIKAKQHNILKEDLPKNRFDLIVCSMSLHHIQNLEVFFKKCYEALKYGGYICVNDLEKENGTFHKRINNVGVYHFGFTKEKLIEICSKLGFSDFIYERVFVYKRDYGDFPLFNFYAKKA